MEKLKKRTKVFSIYDTEGNIVSDGWAWFLILLIAYILGVITVYFINAIEDYPLPFFGVLTMSAIFGTLYVIFLVPLLIVDTILTWVNYFLNYEIGCPKCGSKDLYRKNHGVSFLGRLTQTDEVGCRSCGQKKMYYSDASAA